MQTSGTPIIQYLPQPEIKIQPKIFVKFPPLNIPGLEFNGDIRIKAPVTVENESEPEEEMSEEEFTKEDEIPIIEEEPEENLFGYLQNLTNFLPKEERENYKHSEIREKIENLKTKVLAYTNKKQDQVSEKNSVSSKLKDALSFLQDLTAHTPGS